jgi:hypothetical protein
MNIRKMFTKKFKSKSSKVVAVFMAMSILFQCIAPTCAWALTGGPSQPEVQSFEPVGTSDMVDLFTGDFNYNIPLMDVDGYPINISYHSGITMDQEASWVGLGWNINAGVINRNMRGIPDDFNGDIITKELKMKENKTYGFNTGSGIELFGTSKLKIGLSYSVGVKYNNYTGVSADQSMNISLGAGESGKSPLTGSLGLNSSSEEGLSLQPRIGLNSAAGKNSKAENGLSASVGCSFNSRSGLKALTVNASQMAKNDKGQSVSGSGVSSSFNMGMPTYTPQVGLPMQTLSVTGSFKLGAELYGLHPNFTIGGSYSRQKLAMDKTENPAYGYMNADEGTKHSEAIMDFNREKDGNFSPATPALPLTNFTYDIYSVSGQGVGGSYRAFRSDIGHVFDPFVSNSSDGYSIGAEVGLANVFHVGVDVAVNNVDGNSGGWNDGNLAAKNLTYKESTGDPFYEKYYFKEANEKSIDEDSDFISNKVGNSDLQAIRLKTNGRFNTIAEDKFIGGKDIPTENYRKKRQRRNQPLSILTQAELPAYGLDEMTGKQSTQAKPDHIAEITTLKNDGTRYVYGIAVYNTRQEETSFAVGKTMEGNGGRTPDDITGLVEYTPDVDNSQANESGLDNYYSNTITPPFAHSYMLTAVLSPDYVDNDNVRGPSDGDFGTYTKFSYNKIADYNWRVPVGKNKATFNEGLKSDPSDDKANYLYGTKDLMYLSQIETKNFIAIFETDTRKDGCGVKNKNGELDTDPNKAMRLLKKITLYSKRDLNVNGLANAVPVKTVNFEYDYSLCPSVPNSVNYPTAIDNGKLTLRKIYFTYQNSQKGRFSPYNFKYGSNATNFAYNIKSYDRWGNYKPANLYGIPSAEFPYVEQQTQTNDADLFTSAWSLTEIRLPSGGKIKVEYQSDDYAYVQDKQAGQMFKVFGAEPMGTTFNVANGYLSAPLNNVSETRLIVPLQKKLLGATANADFQRLYLGGLDYVYFRFLMDIRDGNTEYVSGYLRREDIDFSQCNVSTDGYYGAIAVKNTSFDDNSGSDICPITKAAIQYGRLNLPRMVYKSGDNVDASMSSGSFGKDLLIALINSNFAKNIGDAIKGPNRSLYEKYNVGKNVILGKSFIRLNTPYKKKFGGGCRVRTIQMSDEWTGTGIAENSGFSYGQEYLYTLPDGTSSGVASYEPQLGGDENPLKRPVFFNAVKLWAPDDEHYMEEPFGECFFPSPSVGYSRVTVRNLQRTGVTHNATGKTVTEFYTAKDFPTITQRTDITKKQEKKQPLSISALLNLKVLDYMTTTQGYVIELNDMPNKIKKKEIYQQGQSAPISSVEYYYQSDPYLIDKSRLNNTATVINSNGTVNTSAQLGVFYDFVSDMRQSTNETTSSSFNFNTDGFVIPPIPAVIPIPIGLPSFSNEKTQFRSAVVTKVVQRFGILSKTIAKDQSSVVETKNLAYDGESGEVLLTETTTDFNDKIYSLTYPAYWYYDGMGPAYKNIGMRNNAISFSGGVASVPNALAYFAEGDEIALTGGVKGWVISVEPGIVKAVTKDGGGASGKFIRVLRSGRRNQQNVPMATISTLSNPLNAIASNGYGQVTNAKAMEFTNTWRTFCDCFAEAGRGSSNPYILGTKGMYKNKKSYSYLTGRSQSNYNSNTDIRKDGVFSSYSPFYRLNAGKWDMDVRDWTYASEVTEFSPYGVELENRDALGRYSSAQYGYNQSLAVATSINSKYNSMANDNFEDYDFSTCADNHFKFRNATGNLTSTQAHSGKTSMKVTNGNSVTLSKTLQACPITGYCEFIEQHQTNQSAHTIDYVFVGGPGPYTFEWTSSGCDLNVTLDDSGNKISIYQLANTDCYITITVTDKNGCKKIYPDLFIGKYVNPN